MKYNCLDCNIKINSYDGCPRVFAIGDLSKTIY